MTTETVPLTAAQRLVAVEPYTLHHAACGIYDCATCAHGKFLHVAAGYPIAESCHATQECPCPGFTRGACTCGLEAILRGPQA